jgi:hypothetical protein
VLLHVVLLRDLDLAFAVVAVLDAGQGATASSGSLAKLACSGRPFTPSRTDSGIFLPAPN